MKRNTWLLFLSALFTVISIYDVQGQIIVPEQNRGAELDSLRRREELKNDTVVITAQYIRYTTADMLKDSTSTLPLDTTLRNFEKYHLLYQPQRPTINLGNNGLAYRDLLFNPSKTIGFDPGFHALDIYMLNRDSIHYFRARSPYTELYYVNGGKIEQIFKVTHTQNIKPNWNFGANYFRNGSRGFYKNQKADHTNIALFTWYESKNKRYNILGNILFNTLKAGENGSIFKNSIFIEKESLSRDAEIVRLSADRADMPRQTWRQKSIFLKQIYYIGRIDSTVRSITSRVLPTQRVSYGVSYTSDRFKFFRNEADKYDALPDPANDSLLLTNDSTKVKNLQNEVMYSFYLRGRSVSFIKNELKLDVGIQHNVYWYEQMGYKTTFQNTTLKASLGYRFSDRVYISGDLQQITPGSRNAGDYLYEAKTNFLFSRSAGRIILGAYLQNRSPEQLYERTNYQFHTWNLKFENTRISNLSFAYENPKFHFLVKTEYFLLSNYLYFSETTVPKQIFPRQAGSNINLLKISAGKDFKIGKFTLENFIVYQKTDFQSLLRTPELYTYTSLSFSNRFFKVLYSQMGFDVRFNTPFPTQSYSLNLSRFYNGPEIEYSSYPVADVWIKATLKRANLFLRYDYVNQGLFSKGYYTVVRYPMPDAQLKFGVSWKFYN